MAGRKNMLDLTKVQPEVQPNIIQVTKDHEIVDIGGLKMKRRKTSAAVPATAAGAPQANLLKTPYEPRERVSAASQRTPNVEEYEISPELYERLSQNLHNLPETAAPAERLLAICGSVCGAQIEILQKQGDKETAAVLEQVYKSFLETLKAEAEGGAIQFAAPPPPSPELNQEDLRVDLEARKAGLRNRLQMLKEEENEWNELLSKVEALDIDTAAVEGEEDDQPSTAAGEKYAAEEIAALKALRQDLHRKITMQVDGVCTLVGNIEDLIDRANETAQKVHEVHHEKRFANFPHVNSPKFLLKKIMQSGAPSAPPQ